MWCLDWLCTVIWPNLKLFVWLWIRGWGRRVGRERKGSGGGCVCTYALSVQGTWWWDPVIWGPLRFEHIWDGSGYAVARFCPLENLHVLLAKGKASRAVLSTVEWLPFPLTFSCPSDYGCDSLNLPHSLGSEIWLENKGGAKASGEDILCLANNSPFSSVSCWQD